MSARERILERFSSLSPKLQAAARYVVDHPNEVVIQSMRNLAEVAGTKPATLVRLAQQIGFAVLAQAEIRVHRGPGPSRPALRSSSREPGRSRSGRRLGLGDVSRPAAQPGAAATIVRNFLPWV